MPENIDGSSLATAPFRVLLYRHDPAWGFRSACSAAWVLSVFTRRCSREEGGWFVWGNMQTCRVRSMAALASTGARRRMS